MAADRECNFSTGGILGKRFPEAQVHTVNRTSAAGIFYVKWHTVRGYCVFEYCYTNRYTVRAIAATYVVKNS